MAGYLRLLGVRRHTAGLSTFLVRGTPMRGVIAILATAAAVLAAGGAVAPGALAAPTGGGPAAAPLLIGMVNGSGEAMGKQGMTSAWGNGARGGGGGGGGRTPARRPADRDRDRQRGGAGQGGQPERELEHRGKQQRAGDRRGHRCHTR